MSYLLESQNEFERLERQSQHPDYDFRAELEGLRVPHGAKILDAGCGSGIVTRFLGKTHPKARLIGCDLSKDRIELAKSAGEKYSNVEFITADLTKLPMVESQFDLVICRYVFQHLSEAQRQACLLEFWRVLKPGGRLCLIDGDGFLINLYPQSAVIEKAIEDLKNSGLVDFSVGRKLPFILGKAGFSNIQWKIKLVDNKDERREFEIDMMKERFQQASKYYKVFMGEKIADQFQQEYLETLKTPGSVYFTQTFIVWGIK